MTSRFRTNHVVDRNEVLESLISTQALEIAQMKRRAQNRSVTVKQHINELPSNPTGHCGITQPKPTPRTKSTCCGGCQYPGPGEAVEPPCTCASCTGCEPEPMQDECPPPTKGQIDCAKKELTLCKEVYAGTQAKLNHWMQVSIKQCFLEAGLRDCYDLVCVLLQYDCLVADAWVKKKEAQIAAMEIACVTTTRDELLSAIFGRCGGCDEWTGPIGFYLQNAIYNVSH